MTEPGGANIEAALATLAAAVASVDERLARIEEALEIEPEPPNAGRGRPDRVKRAQAKRAREGRLPGPKPGVRGRALQGPKAGREPAPKAARDAGAEAELEAGADVELDVDEAGPEARARRAAELKERYSGRPDRDSS